MLGEPLLSLSTTGKYKIKATTTEKGEERMNETIDRFQKNAVEEIRASLTEFSGHKLVDLRIWTENKVGEPIPTKKGISGKGGPISCPSKGRRASQRGLNRTG